MAHYVLTPASPTSTVFAHTGGDLEVIISKESIMGSGCEVTIQYETATSSGVYKTLPETNLKSPQTAVYQLSACNVRIVLVGGDSARTVDVRVVSVA